MNRKNKTTVRILIISMVLILSGTTLTIVGAQMGGGIHLKQTHFGFLSFPAWGDSKSSNEKHTFKSENKVTSISIDSNLADIDIIESDKFRIETRGIDKSDLKFEDNNGKIRLKAAQNDFYLFSFNTSHKGTKIDIYVPSSCKDVDANLDLGDIDIKDLNLDTLTVDNNLGDVDVVNTTIKRGKFDLDLGSFSFNGDFKESLKVEVNLGDANIELFGKPTDYDYNIDVDLGDINFNDSGQSSRQNNNTNRLLKADLDLGSISIDFR